MKPTVGRIVHYTPHGERAGNSPSSTGPSSTGPYAALVVFVSTAIESTDGMPLVNLVVFGHTGGRFFPQGVAFSETPKPGCWSWPPRTP